MFRKVAHDGGNDRAADVPPGLSRGIVFVSNGLGYLTPTPGLDLPAGSFMFHRLAAYV